MSEIWLEQENWNEIEIKVRNGSNLKIFRIVIQISKENEMWKWLNIRNWSHSKEMKQNISNVTIFIDVRMSEKKKRVDKKTE